MPSSRPRTTSARRGNAARRAAPSGRRQSRPSSGSSARQGISKLAQIQHQLGHGSGGGRAGRGRKAQPVPAADGRPPFHHRVAALMAADWPGEGRRPASNAHDDRVGRSLPYKTVRSLKKMPWEQGGADDESWDMSQFYDEQGNALERPTYTVADLLGARDHAYLRPQRPRGDTVEGLGVLGRLSPELLTMVLKELLVHDANIRVLQGWRWVFPRTRPRLSTPVLRTCRAIHDEGARVLYGANKFEYLLRDPSPGGPRPGDINIVEAHVFDHKFPIERHGHLIRDVKVVIEANRMRLFQSQKIMAAALECLIPEHGPAGPENLKTLTLQIPAQTPRQLNMAIRGASNARIPSDADNPILVAAWFHKHQPVYDVLEQIRCEVIRILAYDAAGDYYEAVIDWRPQLAQNRAKQGHYDPWAGDKVAMDVREREAGRAKARLGSLHYWLNMMKHDPKPEIFNSGPLQLYVPDARPVKALESLPGSPMSISSSSSSSSTRSLRQSAIDASRNLNVGRMLPSLAALVVDADDGDLFDDDDAETTFDPEDEMDEYYDDD